MAKIVFFGTPEYVIPIPKALKNAGYEIVAVVTQPPKPVGRKKILTPSPVARWAKKHKIPVLTNSTLLCRGVEKANVGVLAAYGKIIPKEVIEMFPHGILNVHPSLLPQWRGASPVQAAIASGSTETGVSIIKLDEEVDHGPIINQFRDRVRVSDTSGTLRERLFKKAADALPTVIDDHLSGKITPKEQEHTKATFTTLIKKSDGFTKLQDNVSTERFIRAMSPWPIAWTKLQDGKKLKILKAHLEDGKLMLDIVQLEGKKPVAWRQFREGYPEAKFA